MGRKLSVCVCVCVCVRESEREREREQSHLLHNRIHPMVSPDQQAMETGTYGNYRKLKE